MMFLVNMFTKFYCNFYKKSSKYSIINMWTWPLFNRYTFDLKSVLKDRGEHFESITKIIAWYTCLLRFGHYDVRFVLKSLLMETVE
jgi:hypothetical protein